MPPDSGFSCVTRVLQQHRLHRLLETFGQDVDQIAIGAGQQAVRHLDDGDGAAERSVDRAELEADVSAADDQQRLWDVGKIEGGRRVHHSRIAVARKPERRGNDRHRAGGENRVLELDRVFSARGELDAECVRVDELAEALHVLHLPTLRQKSRAARQPLDDGVLERTELVEVDRRFAEGDAPRIRVTRFSEQVSHVQQRLRRDAAAIDADAARIHFRVDERGLEPEIGGEECRGVPARAASDDDNLSRNHVRAGSAPRS